MLFIQKKIISIIKKDMEKFEKTSRYCVVNLFADFILTKIGTDYLTKIEVIDFNSFA